MVTNKVTMNRKTSYSASPPWILRRRKPQANPTRTRTIATIGPLNNILSAVMVIAPEPTIIDHIDKWYFNLRRRSTAAGLGQN